MLAIPTKSAQAIGDYLTTKPFREVNGLLALLTSCQTVDAALAAEGKVAMTKADAERLAAFDADSDADSETPALDEESPKTNGKQANSAEV